MLKKLAGIEARFEELNRMLADPEVATDYTQVSEYAQERARIEASGGDGTCSAADLPRSPSEVLLRSF